MACKRMTICGAVLILLVSSRRLMPASQVDPRKQPYHGKSTLVSPNEQRYKLRALLSHLPADRVLCVKTDDFLETRSFLLIKAEVPALFCLMDSELHHEKNWHGSYHAGHGVFVPATATISDVTAETYKVAWIWRPDAPSASKCGDINTVKIGLRTGALEVPVHSFMNPVQIQDDALWEKKFEERFSRMMQKMMLKSDSDNGEDEQANAEDVAEALRNEPDKPDRDTNSGPSEQ